jgi:tripartite-type tricarboxylate transporter receptor subunit TctC
MEGRRLLAATMIGFAMIGPSFANDFPTKPIELVVGFAAGGPASAYARAVADVVKDKIGKSVIVVNKPGAGTIVAAESVVNAKPDGYTILLASNTSLINYEFLYKKRSFDPKKDLVPFHGLINQPPTLVVRGDAPYKTLGEMIDYAKQNPGKINFASQGEGSTPHLLIELFKHEAKVDVTHIPYKGSAQITTDMLGGVVDAVFVYPSTIQGLLESGKLKSLAVSGSDRLTAAPDVPSFGELGLPGVELGTWFIMAVPAKTPASVVERLTSAFESALKEPALVEYYRNQGALLLPLKGESIVSFVEKQRPVMKELFERAKIQAE